jgi:hypothetical protein
MGLNMKDNGMSILIKDMEEAIKFGLMEASMKGIGRLIKQTVEVD